MSDPTDYRSLSDGLIAELADPANHDEVADLLAGKRPEMPTPFLPYVQARRLVPDNQLAFNL